MEFRIEKRKPTVGEYQHLRSTTGWDMLGDEAVELAIENSLFSVCATHRDQVIGSGRIVGDAGLYFYIQDLIVIPVFQGQGVGKKLMQELEGWLSEHAPNNAFIGLMAARNVSGFYEQFGYQRRPATGPGMYKLFQN